MIIGIDPGKSGALAALYADGTGDAMPTHLTGGEIDCRAVLRFLDGREPVRLVVLEQVAARPGQGVSSMFSFGKSYGIMIGIIEAAGIQPAHAKPAARTVTGRASARHREDEQDDDTLTHEQIEAEIVRILKLGDPRTPADLASEIGVPVAAIPYRIKALREKHRQLQYRVESNFAIAWWRTC